MLTRYSALPALALTVAPALHAQSALLREGDPAPNGALGHSVRLIQNPTVNETGGYAVSLRTSGVTADQTMIWGHLSGGAGAVLREPSVIGTATQVGMDLPFGIGANHVVYGTRTELAPGGSTLDSIWRDDAAVALEGQPVTGTSRYFTFLTKPAATQGGLPYFYGGMSMAAGGSTIERGWFLNNAPIVHTGQPLFNFPATITSLPTDIALSPNGLRHITVADVADMTGNAQQIVEMNRLALASGGAFIMEGVTIPAAAGGQGDAWDNFGDFEVNDAFQFAFTGDTDGPSATDAFIVRDGNIWIREGDMVDGLTVDGRCSTIAMNSHGELAYIWDTEDGAGNEAQCLFVEDRLVLKEGDPIDWDGDGQLDAGATLNYFNTSTPMAFALDGTLYFVGTASVNGVNLDALFSIDSSALLSTNYCLANANASGAPASISATGSSRVNENDLVLRCSDMPQFAFGFFIVSQTQGFVPNPSGSAGNLCVLGTIGRFQGQIQNSGTFGSFSIPVDLTAIPRPVGTVPVVAGESWNFSTWFRDVGPSGVTSNFSDAIEITFN